MEQYKDYLTKIAVEGLPVPPARENMPSVRMIPTYQMDFPFTDGIPILTGKRMPFYSILGELICFMQGKSDVRDFAKMGCDVWWDNAYKWNVPEGLRKEIPIEDYKLNKGGYSDQFYSLGRIYGTQWRNWSSVNQTGVIHPLDQLTNMINGINEKPYSRYHIMTAWNPAEIESTCQPNCHVYFQASIADRSKGYHRYHTDSYLEETTANYVRDLYDDRNLDLYTHLTQRSCDAFLGVPFNITSYALFSIILGILTKTRPIMFSWVGVNNHIYSDHEEAVNEYLGRSLHHPPKLWIDVDAMDTLQKIEAIRDLDDLKRIFKLSDYFYGSKISAKLSVGL